VFRQARKKIRLGARADRQPERDYSRRRPEREISRQAICLGRGLLYIAISFALIPLGWLYPTYDYCGYSPSSLLLRLGIDRPSSVPA